jgi:hypothetical protein
VSERIGHHIPPGLLLEAIVPNGAGSVQPFLDIARFQGFALIIGVVGPDPGETVCLKFQTDGELVGLYPIDALLERLYLARNAQQVLDVMTDFVGDDIRLGEIARGIQFILQVLIKAEVNVDLLVGGAVERPHRRFGHTAGGLHGTGKQHQFWVNVLPPHLAKQSPPGVFCVRQDNRDEFDLLIQDGFPCGGSLRRGGVRTRLLQNGGWVAAQQHHHQCQYDGADASANYDWGCATTTALVFYVVTASPKLPPHTVAPDPNERPSRTSSVGRRD